MCVKYVRIYIRGGYIKRVSFIYSKRNGKEVEEKKTKKRSSVGVKTPLVGVYYTYIYVYKKIYIIRFTNRNGCCVIRRAWRKCVESLTRIRRRLLLIVVVVVVVVVVHRRGAYIYIYIYTACVENGSQLFGTLFSGYSTRGCGGSVSNKYMINYKHISWTPKQLHIIYIYSSARFSFCDRQRITI